VTITTESSKNGAVTLPRINFSGYAEHVTIFSCTLLIMRPVNLVVGLGLRSVLGSRLDLVSGSLVVMHTCLDYFSLSPSLSMETAKYLPLSASNCPAMSICGQRTYSKTAFPAMKAQLVAMMRRTAPAGRSFSLDMMRPPAKPPSAPADADDSAAPLHY